ncbi:hypothetical protein HB364_07560 [Pseudoflavitalea sp. X16]|uniref:hypothetical protein n=1 Tax=Paraflavitalea devenefica TaxID=2716334 RepID=UPI00141E18DC|nr:hypothetical protein [Paraflavitalea devenefica]NII24929.1 hypothetical protein [Paraflavitalea devenefica]
MFLRITILLCLLGGGYLTGVAQSALVRGDTNQGDTFFILQRKIAGEFTDFTVDNLGNIYVLSQAGQLKKMSPAGDSIAVFNNVRQYGKVHFIDVTNPLKVLLYFKDFGTVVTLDRFLNTRSTLDLRKLQLFQVKSIGQAYDNNIWAFDELESKLKRVGEDGRIIDQSTDFRLLFDSVPSPSFIVDQNKQLYLYDSSKGVYLFDYYGAFKNRIRFTGWTDFSVINNTIFGRDAGMLYRYEPGTLNLQQYRIPATMQQARKIKIIPGNLYLLRDHQLEVYSYR